MSTDETTSTEIRSDTGETVPDERTPDSESGEQPDVAVRQSADRVAELEREGDIAADYLEALLDIADLDGDLDMDVENDRAMVQVIGAELRQLVGPAGEVLDALQELTRLAVLRETGERSRLMLDIGGFRAAKRAEVAAIGRKAVEDATASAAPVRLPPMTPFERKVVHDVVADAGLTSSSEGEDPERYVVVRPA
ncbi:MAG: R3H domain-containing nucleic acid-binding protein [Candidatus Nanopelagicales bacterium]